MATSPALISLRPELERFRRQPGMRQAELTTALTDLNAGLYILDADDESALIALFTGKDPASQLELPPDARASQIAARASAQNVR